MGKETYKPKAPFNMDNEFSNPSSLIFDLPELVYELKHEKSWERGELKVIVLLNSIEKQIILTAIHPGTDVSFIQANDSVSFQTIEGKLIFNTQKKMVILDKGQLLSLHENIKYILSTEEETIFLLIISNGIVQTTDN